MYSYSGKRRELVRPASRWVTAGLALALLALVLFSCVLLGGRQYVLLQYYDELQAMDDELVALEAEVSQLKCKQEEILQDPFSVERLARERMNYSMPGEVIFRFEGTQ